MADAELRAFLSGLAEDPERLAALIRDPDAVLAASDLDEEDKMAILSGDPTVLQARLFDPDARPVQMALLVVFFFFAGRPRPRDDT